jgi:hypothetical protein
LVSWVDLGGGVQSLGKPCWSSSMTYWCLAGNGSDWGLLGWLLLVYGSFPHSLLSTSKFLVMANWTPELCRWNPTNFLCWIRGLTAVNGFGPWTRSYRSQSKSRGATVNCSFLTPT